MYEVSNMIYLIRATKPGFFSKLSVNRAHPNANVCLAVYADVLCSGGWHDVLCLTWRVSVDFL
jgi:hypothetical protein